MGISFEMDGLPIIVLDNLDRFQLSQAHHYCQKYFLPWLELASPGGKREAA